MRPDQIIIGLLLFSLFVIGGVSIFVSMTQDYEVSADVSLFQGANNTGTSSVYNQINKLSNTTEEISNKLTAQEGVSGLTAVGNILSGIWGVLLLLPQSFGIVGGILSAIAAAIGIPVFITTTIFIIFVVGVLFTIIYLISKATSF